MQDLLVELCAFTQTGWLSVSKHLKGLNPKDLLKIGSIDLIQVQGGRHPSGCSGDWFSKWPNASSHKASGGWSYYSWILFITFFYLLFFLAEIALTCRRSKWLLPTEQRRSTLSSTGVFTIAWIGELGIENWSKIYGKRDNLDVLQTVGLGAALDRAVRGGEADEGEGEEQHCDFTNVNHELNVNTTVIRIYVNTCM